MNLNEPLLCHLLLIGIHSSSVRKELETVLGAPSAYQIVIC